MTSPNDPAPEPTNPAPEPTPEPVPADPETLAALIAKVNAMEAELKAARGEPTDPVGAARANLVAHVNARHNSGLSAFAELKDVVSKLPDTLEAAASDLVRTVAADLRDHVEGASYIKQLANDLHKAVLTAK